MNLRMTNLIELVVSGSGCSHWHFTKSDARVWRIIAPEALEWGTGRASSGTLSILGEWFRDQTAE